MRSAQRAKSAADAEVSLSSRVRRSAAAASAAASAAEAEAAATGERRICDDREAAQSAPKVKGAPPRVAKSGRLLTGRTRALKEREDRAREGCETLPASAASVHQMNVAPPARRRLRCLGVRATQSRGTA
eukprot:4406280-Pleurochrysis_carterae.AAC.1